MANGNKPKMTSWASYKLEQRMYQMITDHEFKKDDLEMLVGAFSKEEEKYVSFSHFNMVIDGIHYEVHEDRFIDEIDYGRQWYHTYYFTLQPLKDVMHGMLLSEDEVHILPSSIHTVECKTMDYNHFLYLKAENPEWRFSIPTTSFKLNVHCHDKNDAVELKLKFN